MTISCGWANSCRRHQQLVVESGNDNRRCALQSAASYLHRCCALHSKHLLHLCRNEWQSRSTLRYLCIKSQTAQQHRTYGEYLSLCQPPFLDRTSREPVLDTMMRTQLWCDHSQPFSSHRRKRIRSLFLLHLLCLGGQFRASWRVLALSVRGG